MAAANEPQVMISWPQKNRHATHPLTLSLSLSLLQQESTRLFKPLNYWRLLWMRKKIDVAKEFSMMRGEEKAAAQSLRTRLDALSNVLRQQRAMGMNKGGAADLST